MKNSIRGAAFIIAAPMLASTALSGSAAWATQITIDNSNAVPVITGLGRDYGRLEVLPNGVLRVTYFGDLVISDATITYVTALPGEATASARPVEISATGNLTLNNVTVSASANGRAAAVGAGAGGEGGSAGKGGKGGKGGAGGGPAKNPAFGTDGKDGEEGEDGTPGGDGRATTQIGAGPSLGAISATGNGGREGRAGPGGKGGQQILGISDGTGKVPEPIPFEDFGRVGSKGQDGVNASPASADPTAGQGGQGGGGGGGATGGSGGGGGGGGLGLVTVLGPLAGGKGGAGGDGAVGKDGGTGGDGGGGGGIISFHAADTIIVNGGAFEAKGAAGSAGELDPRETNTGSDGADGGVGESNIFFGQKSTAPSGSKGGQGGEGTHGGHGGDGGAGAGGSVKLSANIVITNGTIIDNRGGNNAQRNDGRTIVEANAVGGSGLDIRRSSEERYDSERALSTVNSEARLTPSMTRASLRYGNDPFFGAELPSSGVLSDVVGVALDDAFSGAPPAGRHDIIAVTLVRDTTSFFGADFVDFDLLLVKNISGSAFADLQIGFDPFKIGSGRTDTTAYTPDPSTRTRGLDSRILGDGLVFAALVSRNGTDSGGIISLLLDGTNYFQTSLFGAGEVGYVTFAPVPLPGAAVFMVAGLAALIRGRSRQRLAA